ncbi:MAG: NADH-quinone oxidoreductase subunit J [Phycisphaeraceae bacterium]
MDYTLYIASVMGAIAVYLMMPRRGFTPRKIGALLGAVTLGALWLILARSAGVGAGMPGGAWTYYYIFSAVAIASAVRVITHTRPVYSALWFVMVVLASAGLFLLLDAEFMAFAMVIIYGGAILVTYVFVIMLAAQSSGAEDDAAAPVYDRVAREPVAGVATGFLLLAVLLSVLFQPMQPNNAVASDDQAIIANVLTGRAEERLTQQIRDPKQQKMYADAVAKPDRLTNTQRVGMDLFAKHPLGLELAGVILLISLVGAVVIAKTKVEAEAAHSA